MLILFPFSDPNETDGEVVSNEQGIRTKNKNDEKLATIFRDGFGELLPLPALKKYIQYAKMFKPKLLDETRGVISDAFVRMREHSARTQPITPRSIEALIRLSTAHAKIRLSNYVDPIDAHVAIGLVEMAYFGHNFTKIN